MGYPNYQDTNPLETEPEPYGTYSGDPTVDAMYKEARTTQAMHILNNIRGIEFESFEDWMDHVDKVEDRIVKGLDKN